jgi:uncharacterized membrane protein YobD (UPF0266 family)
MEPLTSWSASLSKSRAISFEFLQANALVQELDTIKGHTIYSLKRKRSMTKDGNIIFSKMITVAIRFVNDFQSRHLARTIWILSFFKAENSRCRHVQQ